MAILFLICAGAGGTLLLLQFLASLIGFGGDDGDGGHDGHADGGDHGHADHADHGHDADGSVSNWLFSVLSFKSVLTAITFFGLGGMAALSYRFDDLAALGIALGCGVLALYAVGMLMRSLYRLKADGTIRIDRAVGRTGAVYLKVPARRAGAGKVTLTLQNRSVEYQAVTAGDELPTGSKVVVVAVHRPDTLEVALAPVAPEPAPSENASHA
jgi:hypothetical protein